MALSILFIGPKIAKKSIHKILLKPSFLSFGAKTRSDSCRSCFSDHFGRVAVRFRPMNNHFVTIWVFFAGFSAKKVGILDLFWLAACRRRFFLAKNDGFGGKMMFLRFIRDVNNPIGSLSQFFGSIRPFPKKKLVLSLSKKIFKNVIFLEISVFH